jgi:hypothetical protein
MIRNLIAIEDAYINVNNPDFILARDATLNIFKKKNDPPSEENVFQRQDPNHNIYSNQRDEIGAMKEREEWDELEEDKTERDFKRMEKPKESELHNINNRFSVGYEAMSNMKTKVGNILLPSVP